MSPELQALTIALNDLYRRSHRLSLRELSELIRSRDDLRDDLSYETVRRIFHGKPTRLIRVLTLVTVLAEQAVPDQVLAETARFRQLWEAANDTGDSAVIDRGGTAVATSQDSAVLRGLTRTLYEKADPVAVFLRIKVFVPHIDGQFMIAPTPTSGVWMCAFTAENRVRAHRPDAQPAWQGDYTTMLGAELVKQVCALPIPVGVLLDPALDAELHETLPLPYHLLVELDSH